MVIATVGGDVYGVSVGVGDNDYVHAPTLQAIMG